jgi:hypothetical protein
VDVRGVLTRWRSRYAPLWRLLSWTVFGIGTVYCLASQAGLTAYGGGVDELVPGDAWNYWAGEPYEWTHYRYSPVFFWLSLPLRALPFELFVGLWTVLHLAAIAWLGPWTILLAFDDVIRRNVNTFLAVAVVLGVRGHAWTWAVPLLTKVTPGVGALYHVGKRDWRSAGVGVGTTLGIVAAGALIAPDLWLAWVESLRAGTDNYQTVNLLAPLPFRVAIGAALCLAATRSVALLPLGMVIAMPGLLPSSFAVLAARPRLRRAETRRDTDSA